MGKVKKNKKDGYQDKLKRVSIPNGKGKVKKTPYFSWLLFVSIPNGKGKKVDKARYVERAKFKYQFPMGKVKK